MNDAQLPVLAVVHENKVDLLKDVYFTPIGMHIERRLEYEEYDDVLNKFLLPLGRARKFAVGDLLNSAEKVIPGSWTDLVDPMDLDTKTINKWKWVSQKVPAILRRMELSWSHHEVVAGIEERNEVKSLLALAVRENMSVREFKKVVKGEKTRKTGCPQCGAETKVCRECGHEF